jgi:hypothetical protein
MASSNIDVSHMACGKQDTKSYLIGWQREKGSYLRGDQYILTYSSKTNIPQSSVRGQSESKTEAMPHRNSDKMGKGTNSSCGALQHIQMT